MSGQLQPMTEAEYLAWEDHQELPHEFDGHRPTAMNGSTISHDLIQGNLKFALMSRLRGGRCQAFGPTTRVPTGQARYRYPDAVVTCTPQEGKSRDLVAPIVIFEIASESTATVDRKAKLIEYAAISSLVRYVILEQDEALATIVARDDDHWRLDFRRAGQTIDMPEIGITVPVDDIYEGLNFPPEPP